MQQQHQKVAGSAQAQGNGVQRGPFPWGRMLAAFCIVLLLSVLAVAGLLATGHVIDYAWFFIAPTFSSLIGAIFPVLQWLFPFNPVAWRQDSQQSSVSPPSQPGTLSALAPQASAPSVPPILAPVVQVFHFDEIPLPSPTEFYDRASERNTLLNRINKRSSTALVGEYRIGKSWLMQYLQQVAPISAPPGVQVCVGKLSATNAQCHTLPGFVKRALEVLNAKASSNGTPLERLTLASRNLKKQGIIPVLCIDEFASLMGRPGFDKIFVEGLRAIAEDEGLVLITASREPLHEVIKHITGQASPLFNIMPELTLQLFTEAEAKTFIGEKSQQAGLSGDEQEFFLACASISRPGGAPGWPPLRLQLVGQMLCDDKYSAAADQRVYNLSDPVYQTDFKTRLEKHYQSVVRQP